MTRTILSLLLGVALSAGVGCHSSGSTSGGCSCPHTGASACKCNHCNGSGAACTCPK